MVGEAPDVALWGISGIDWGKSRVRVNSRAIFQEIYFCLDKDP